MRDLTSVSVSIAMACKIRCEHRLGDGECTIGGPRSNCGLASRQSFKEVDGLGMKCFIRDQRDFDPSFFFYLFVVNINTSKS
jgi:hypothetical protein